jgi:hypothetical protein
MIAPFVEDWLLPLQWKYRNSYSSKVRSPVVCQPRRVSTEEDADFSFDRRKGHDRLTANVTPEPCRSIGTLPN